MTKSKHLTCMRLFKASCVIAFATIMAVFSLQTFASVPNPAVTKIPSGETGNASRNYPFGATDINLRKVQYVEEEYFLGGMANSYDFSLGAVISSGPYKTRMHVIKPKKPSKFNGTVVLVPLNAAFGFDMNVTLARTKDFLVKEGYAMVGVTVNTVPAAQLKSWNPGRYGEMSISTDDYLFDIISQAAQAVRSPIENANPMEGLKVERVILAGFSYQAANVTDYHNYIQQNANVIDAILALNGGGTIRTDLPKPIPVMLLLSETEVAFSFIADSAQSDSEYLRVWSVAGANHYDTQTSGNLVPLFSRDGVNEPDFSVCDDAPNVFSLIPFYKVQNTAIDGLHHWVKEGKALPIAPRMEFDMSNAIVRDNYGNASGGIQLAEHAVATATNTQGSGPGLCFLAGANIPFSQSRLDELYPTHGDYVSRIVKVNKHNLDAGFLLQQDSVDTIIQSSTSSIGK